MNFMCTNYNRYPIDQYQQISGQFASQMNQMHDQIGFHLNQPQPQHQSSHYVHLQVLDPTTHAPIQIVCQFTITSPEQLYDTPNEVLYDALGQYLDGDVYSDGDDGDDGDDGSEYAPPPPLPQQQQEVEVPQEVQPEVIHQVESVTLEVINDHDQSNGVNEEEDEDEEQEEQEEEQEQGQEQENQEEEQEKEIPIAKDDDQKGANHQYVNTKPHTIYLSKYDKYGDSYTCNVCNEKGHLPGICHKYKTNPCKFVDENGDSYCEREDSCPYYHNEDERRVINEKKCLKIISKPFKNDDNSYSISVVGCHSMDHNYEECPHVYCDNCKVHGKHSIIHCPRKHCDECGSNKHWTHRCFLKNQKKMPVPSLEDVKKQTWNYS